MATTRPSGRPTVADLEARVAELEAQNAELAAAGPERRGRWRTPVAAVLIVLAALLTPVAIISGWARVVLTDTDGFVATYAPLVRDPRVQAYLTDQIVAAIEQQFDIDATVGTVIDGLSENLQRPATRAALNLLRQPAADGIRSTIRAAASRVVTSDAFAQVWQESLRLSHDQATRALAGDTSSTVTISGNELGIRLGPLIAKVRDALVEQGFAFASLIPAIDRTVVIASASVLPQAQLAYRAVLAVGSWLGLLVVALLAAGVLIARRRWRATLGAATGLGLGAVAVLAAVAIARVVAQASVPATVMPNDVLLLFYDTVGDPVTDLATATLVLTVVVVVVTWLGGPFRSSAKLRGAWTSLTASLRTWGDGHGLSTGRFGEWLDAWRVVVRVAVGVCAGVVLALNRPISAGLVIGTAAVAVLVLLVVGLLARPANSAGD